MNGLGCVPCLQNLCSTSCQNTNSHLIYAFLLEQSYVEEFWNESYLKPDASVVLNLNPYFVLEEGPDPKIANDQLHRAASLCFASIKMASSLRNQTLKPDIFKGKALCMDQFKALFGSSRQPTVIDSDDVHVYSDSTHGELLS